MSLLHRLGCALLLGCGACAHASDQDPAVPVGPAQSEAFTYAAPVAPAPERARPRLSRTVTLGQGSQGSDGEAYTAPRPVQPPPAGPNVVVQNNVVVQQPPAFYGGYGGYPAGYGYGYGYGSRGLVRDGFGSGTRAPSTQWGSSGWEGSRRTAAPGQTPGVGGNWPAAPSYGPSPMR